MAHSERFILHADMDAFFASVEQRDRPELRGRPVIVGGTSGRGVVSAASYEARTFGVRSAMPAFRARELCPEGVFLPPDLARYAAVSAQVRAVFEELTPLVEPLALDEAFLDVSGSVRLLGGPLDLARRLKRRVREETDLVVSCGVAPNKLVAKLACTLGKPDGLLVVPPEAVRWLLDPLPVRRLWGVGPVLEERLVAAGFTTFRELAEAPIARLANVVGDRAPVLARLARGEDERPVVNDRAPRSIGEEATFERDVVERAVLASALTAHAEAVARRLRRAGLVARTVTLRVKLARVQQRRRGRADPGGGEPVRPLLARSRTLPAPTDDGAALREVALALWDDAAIREPVRLIGVAASQLEPRAAEQLELFARRAAGRANSGAEADEAAARRERSRRLGPALDAIQARWGAGAIRRAVDAPAKVTPSGRSKRGE
ncbi:MAG: DNA polymerase IV [Polyangiaceae bacterium]|nr:DNA polymerase IV [Polyangiaceae bacterium]